jgi:hypothetical protein
MDHLVRWFSQQTSNGFPSITFFWENWHTQPLGNEASPTQDCSIPCKKKCIGLVPQNKNVPILPILKCNTWRGETEVQPLIYCDFDLGDLFRSPEKLVSNSNVAISRTIVHSFIHHQVSIANHSFETHIPATCPENWCLGCFNKILTFKWLAHSWTV